MDDWLKWPRGKASSEAEWIVAVELDAIRISNNEGGLTVLLKADLAGVAIKTDGTGPWGPDVWWLLFGANDEQVHMFPQGAIGEAAALDYPMALDGFDHEAMITAMGCTQNTVFPVWQAA